MLAVLLLQYMLEVLHLVRNLYYIHVLYYSIVAILYKILDIKS